MTPQDALAILADLQSTADFPDLLNRGTGAIVDRMIDVMGDTLEQSIPALATARSACNAIPDCEGSYKELRYKLGRLLFKQTGVWAVVNRLVRMWQAIPSVARDVIAFSSKLMTLAPPFLSEVLPAVANPVAIATKAIELGEDWVENRPFGKYDVLTRGENEIRELLASVIDQIPVLSQLSDLKDEINDAIGDIPVVGGILNKLNPLNWF